jgi:hypothetical protein
MKIRLISAIVAGLALGTAAVAQEAAPPAPASQGSGDGAARGRQWGGMMGSRGVMGTVTEVAEDHYSIKNELGEIYTIHFSANTRIMKQTARPAGANGQERGMGNGRNPPQTIKAADIKVGDAIMANGEVDATAKSVGAVFVVQLDPERAKQMREMQANFGKTWLMGKVTAVNDLKLTLLSPVDNNPHTFAADENTSFRKRRDPITLADVQVGDNVRVEGALKEGKFVATTVAVMGMPPATGSPMGHPGTAPQ